MTGPNLDIVTLRPKEEVEEKSEEKEKENLIRKSKNAGLADSAAAQDLGDLIEKKLMNLFEEFIKKDPAGQICLEMLTAIRNKTVDGKMAAKELREKFLG